MPRPLLRLLRTRAPTNRELGGRKRAPPRNDDLYCRRLESPRKRIEKSLKERMATQIVIPKTETHDSYGVRFRPRYSSLAFHYIENLERLFSTGLPRQCAQRALCILGAAILITQQLSAPAAVGIL